jgi:Tfp pilus assembly protein PilO
MSAAAWRRRLPVLAAAILFAAANVVFFVTYRSGAKSRRDALEARRAALQHSVTGAEAEADRLAAQKDRLSGVSEAIDDFYGHRIGTQKETLAGVVDDLHVALKQAGVATNTISYSTIGDKSLPLVAMRITFPVRCDYTRFKKLLHEFEASRRWIAIRSVTISRDTESAGTVQVQFELATYFAERGLEPPKPAAEARATVPGGRAG